MRKRIVALLLALVLCMGISAPALASNQQFTDVPASFWAYTEIMSAAQKGITGGYADGTFKYTTKEQLIDFCVTHMATESWPAEQVRAHMEAIVPTLKHWKK